MGVQNSKDVEKVKFQPKSHNKAMFNPESIKKLHIFDEMPADCSIVETQAKYDRNGMNALFESVVHFMFSSTSSLKGFPLQLGVIEQQQ